MEKTIIKKTDEIITKINQNSKLIKKLILEVEIELTKLKANENRN